MSISIPQINEFFKEALDKNKVKICRRCKTEYVNVKFGQNHTQFTERDQRHIYSKEEKKCIFL